MSKQPNFLFIITDQHRADYLGCQGHPVVRTPNIDAIAATGTRFERFYVASPVCMPNRATLLTGRMPSAHGLRHNGNHLSYDASTFVEVLREGGYRTALIGKSHVQAMTAFPAPQPVDPAALGAISEAWKDDGGDYLNETPERYLSADFYAFRPPYYGYDQVDMVTNHGDQAHGHYYQWLKSKTPEADAWRDKANQLPHDYTCPQAVRTPIPEELYPTSFIRDRAISFLDGAKGEDRPFFAFVSFPDPHHPFTPPGKYWDMYNPADFNTRLPWEAHRNPVPPMLAMRAKHLDKTEVTSTQEAFRVDERELKEAMALSCGMITMIDDAIGEIVAALKANGQYENTVIVFNADHGDYLGDYGLLLKGALQLNSITQVPFIWSDPASRAARVTRALASTADLAPTIIERAGLKPYWGIQGRSLSAPINGAGTARDSLVIEYQDNMPRMGFATAAFVRTLLMEQWRLSIYKGEAWGELYDRVADPDETHNLWDEPAHAKTRAALTEKLVHEMMDLVDQSPRALRRA